MALYTTSILLSREKNEPDVFLFSVFAVVAVFKKIQKNT